MGYRIKTVSELTGIPKNTLVAWERRYNILNPERLPNGYRLYSDQDIAVLTQIKGALADGLRISEAVDLISKPAVAVEVSEPAHGDEDAFEGLREQLERALLHYDRGLAEQLARRLVAVPHRVVIEQVYFPLLRAVGRGWENGDVTVAQEHFVSAYVREQLIGMLIGLGCGPANGLHVACTTFPEDRHEIGVLGLAVQLAARGCRVTYLGANTPLLDLGRFASELRPARLFVSMILAAEPSVVIAYAEELRKLCRPETKIFIGGAGLPNIECPPAGVSLLRDWRDLDLLGRV